MKIKKRFLIPIILIAVILLGPRLKFPSFDGQIPEYEFNLETVEAYVQSKESKIENLKPDNEARIVWADSSQSKTAYSVVYLHGYSASPMEGDGVHFDFAKRYGCNLFLARLKGHGIRTDEAFLDVTSKDWVESAKEAIAIGKTIGEKVIVLSASTGSTLANYLDAENPGLIDGHVYYSPNFKMVDQSGQLLLYPWGLHVARMVMGGKYRIGKFNPQDSVYWTFKQRLEGVGALVHLVNHASGIRVYKKIKTPYLLAYYYKNEEERDKTVSIPEMELFHQTSPVPEANKRMIAFPECGDHCMVSKLRSKDLSHIREETFKFAEEVLGMQPILPD